MATLQPIEPMDDESKNAEATEYESGSDKENPPADKETVKVKKLSLRKRVSRPFAWKKKSEEATAVKEELVTEEEAAPTGEEAPPTEEEVEEAAPISLPASTRLSGAAAAASWPRSTFAAAAPRAVSSPRPW